MDYYYMLTFESTREAMLALELSREEIRALVMPVPSDIQSGCGLALRFPDSTEEEIITFGQKLGFPCRFYKMSKERINGSRIVIKLYEQ